MTKNDVIPVDWNRWSALKPTLIRPLPGGLTNHNYLIGAGDEQLVLRKNSAISAALNLDRAGEAEALHLAHMADLCAPVVYCDPNYQYLVTRYIEKQSWAISEKGALSRLARLLRNIHQLPHISAQLNIQEKATKYWQSIDVHAEFAAELQSLEKTVSQHIRAAKALNYGDCLCHNDLLRENLILADDGELYAIDWEYAAMGDPFYDLAVIVTGHHLTAQQQELLLNEYLNRAVKSDDWQRLAHWQFIYRYLAVLWYAVQWSSGAMAQGKTMDYITEQIKNLKN